MYGLLTDVADFAVSSAGARHLETILVSGGR
jgi:hypothetical protein